MPVRVTTDALPGEVVQGTLTAINPDLDAATRSVRVQATFANPDERLRPGMFVNVSRCCLPGSRQVLVIPATAVLSAPYGDSVFVVEDRVEPAGGPPGKVVRQQFTQLGDTAGDFVAVDSGLKAGETVVSTGIFKLRNGMAVIENNDLAPEIELHPEPSEELTVKSFTDLFIRRPVLALVVNLVILIAGLPGDPLAQSSGNTRAATTPR